MQVVELPREGPEAALKLFGGLPNLRVLVIGGDGTVAWILSCIDSIQVNPCGAAVSHLLWHNHVLFLYIPRITHHVVILRVRYAKALH